MAGQPKKQYGLIQPKAKVKQNFLQKKNIFEDEDDDDDTNSSQAPDWMRASMETKVKKKQTQLEMSRALAEDATVYEYDEVYDDMKASEVQTKAASKTAEARKPRYIANLLKHAEIRERERERRVEKKVQKEREAEGEEFKDKEVFVTSSYRKKMEEMEKAEEEERRKDEMESVLDVKKQGDMSGFYRHLYRQTMGEEKGQKEKSEEKELEEVKIKKTAVKNKAFRKRKEEESEEEEEDDSSSESASEEEEEVEIKAEEVAKSREEKEMERRRKMKEEKEKRERRKRKIEMGEESSEDEPEENIKGRKERKIERHDENSPGKENVSKKPKEKKPKKDIWKKVTVGKVLEEALQRYFQRKATRTNFPYVM